MADRTNTNTNSNLVILPRLIHSTSEGIHTALFRAKVLISYLFRVLQEPAPIFPHKPYALATALILGFLQVTTLGKPTFNSNPVLYYTAVTGYLIYCFLCGFESISSSHPIYPIPRSASNLLHRTMFLVGSLSFAALASFLFPEANREVLFALICSIMSACAVLYWVYHRLVLGGQYNSKYLGLSLTRLFIFFEDMWRRLARYYFPVLNQRSRQWRI